MKRRFRAWFSSGGVALAISALAPLARAQSGAEPVGAPEVSPSALTATDSPPPPRERFGRRGQYVLTGATSLGFSSTAYSHGDASSTSVAVSPGIDYFVAHHVSLGVDFTYGYFDATGYGADSALVQSTSKTFGAGARLGLELPVGDVVSLYLRTTLGYSETNSKESIVSGPSSNTGGPLPSNENNSRGAYLNLYLPLLVHLAPHFFVGLGPSIYHDLTRTSDGRDYQNLRTTVGAGFVIGGWL